MIPLVVIGFLAIVGTESVTLKKECPHDEVHKSCAFYDEYYCWQEADRQNRVRLPPKRLQHCRSGCYCKRGLVREFPDGECIQAINCRNRKLREVLRKIPTDFPDLF